MPDSRTPRRRGWIDALVATALRWNDRLSRPIGAPPAPPSGTRSSTPVADARSEPTSARFLGRASK